MRRRYGTPTSDWLQHGLDHIAPERLSHLSTTGYCEYPRGDSLLSDPRLRVLVLTTVGRKTGRDHSTALTYIHDNNRLLVLGSNFGQPHHPSWSSNLLAHPQATVTIRGANTGDRMPTRRRRTRASANTFSRPVDLSPIPNPHQPRPTHIRPNAMSLRTFSWPRCDAGRTYRVSYSERRFR